MTKAVFDVRLDSFEVSLDDTVTKSHQRRLCTSRVHIDAREILLFQRSARCFILQPLQNTFLAAEFVFKPLPLVRQTRRTLFQCLSLLL